MNEPLISIKIDGLPRVFQPGEKLTGEVQIDAVNPDELQSVEISVLWYTEGKGDEDLGVHYFQRIATEAERAALHELRSFRTVLPNSPLSYDGRIVKVRWCVRVRAFATRGREFTSEQPFQLGSVPRPGKVAVGV